MTRVNRPEEIIRTTEQIIALAGFEGKIGIAFDEWNLRGWYHPRLSTPAAIAARDRNDISATYTMADAVFSGEAEGGRAQKAAEALHQAAAGALVLLATKGSAESRPDPLPAPDENVDAESTLDQLVPRSLSAKEDR
jgi:alpha-L-arabinofuranosidase